MVLTKKTLPYLLLLSSLSANAIDSEEIEKLDTLYKNNDYEGVLAEVSDLEEGASWQRDYAVFEYKALALEKQGEFDEAAKIYKQLSKRRFGKRASKVILSIYRNKDFSLDFDGVQRMTFYYRKITELMVMKYESSNRGTSPKERKARLKKAMAYIKVFRALDEEGEAVELFKQRLLDKREKLNSFNYKFGYYPFLSYISFQDHLVLTRSDGASRSLILNTTSGSCTGLGLKLKNAYFEFNTENCILLGSSTVSTGDGALMYDQSGVGVSGFYGGIGLLNISLAEDLAFGGHLNYLYRSGDWTVPDGTEMTEQSYLRFGYSLRTTWSVDKFSFAASIGKIFKNESAIYQFVSSYNF